MTAKSVLVAIIFFAEIIFTTTVFATGVEDTTAPDPDAQPLALHILYPAAPDHADIVQGNHLPLIILSHGASGSSEGHEDTARALAAAGYVVAAITHTGDNYRDTSAVRAGTNLSDRPRHVSRAIDYMLGAWRGHAQIDPARIGMFGFSAGGFTALVLAGGEPHLGKEHCLQKPAAWDCEYLRKHDAKTPPPARWIHDTRIKAAVIAAPAVGYGFEPDGLSQVRIPIQLWAGGRDVIVEDSAQIVRRLLPLPPEYHLVPDAEHFAFLMPCDWRMRAIIGVMTWFGTENICRDPDGFDRIKFHKEFNAEVLRFFSAQLLARAASIEAP